MEIVFNIFLYDLLVLELHQSQYDSMQIGAELRQ